MAEEQIWRLFGLFQNTAWDGEIKYPSVFNIRDRNYEMEILKKASDSNPTDPIVRQLIDKKIMQTLKYNCFGLWQEQKINGDAPFSFSIEDF